MCLAHWYALPLLANMNIAMHQCFICNMAFVHTDKYLEMLLSDYLLLLPGITVLNTKALFARVYKLRLPRCWTSQP